MVLQNLLFPDEEICNKTDLYYHTCKGTSTWDSGLQALCLAPGSTVDTLTYFNCFSSQIWLKYTTVEQFTWDLSLTGDVEIQLVGANLSAEDKTKVTDGALTPLEISQLPIEETIIKELNLSQDNEVTSPVTASLTFDATEISPYALCFLRIKNKSLTDASAYIFNGVLESFLASHWDVKLAIDICTFKREQYVTKTLERLQPLCDDELLEVFVSDNGNTLDIPSLSKSGIHIVYNKNVGGSGGFTRGLMEILQVQEERNFTHMIFMDDDVVFHPECIRRTWAFLACRKEQYTKLSVGGSLLRSDAPAVQHEKGALRNAFGLTANKNGYVLSHPSSIIANDMEMPANYNGWWYCCMPLTQEMREDLPLPLFIHEDDQEYGMRRIQHLATLNGIGVWHEPFENRRASNLQYYDVRNMLIANAIHEPDFTWKQAFRRVFMKFLLNNLLRYRYDDMNFNLKAVEDFCSGMDGIKELDPLTLHQELMVKSYGMTDCDSELTKQGISRNAHREVDEFHIYEKEVSLGKKHMLTLNGWFIPDRSPVAHPVKAGSYPTAFYGKKSVLLYDPDSRKGFVVTRKYRKLVTFFRNTLQLRSLMRKNYDRVAEEYRSRYQELTNWEFWEEYLK